MNAGSASVSPKQTDDILQIPDLVDRRLAVPSENILELQVDLFEPLPASSERSVIDITGHSAKIPPPVKSQLIKCPTGVPTWVHQYVYSADEINGATTDQRNFYMFFRDAFARGIYYDIEGNSNYSFILLFDIVDGYNVGDNLKVVKGYLDKLGELFPRTKPYIRSSLIRRMKELGDSVGLAAFGDESVGNRDSYYNPYAYGPWGFGSSRKERLGLTGAEVKLLDRLTYPTNNFLGIQHCCDQVIRLFLRTEKRLAAKYKRVGTDVVTVFDELADTIARKEHRFQKGSYNYKYSVQSGPSELHTLIFKYCENSVREAYGHKRKLDTKFYKKDIPVAEVEEKLLTHLRPIIAAEIESILAPDHDTELLLNAQNPARWKMKFERIISGSSGAGSQIVRQIHSLAAANKNNPAIENIFFESAKALAPHDKQAALEMYLYYIHYDLQSIKFDDRKLPKNVQKSLFPTEQHLVDFESIVARLVASRDLKSALTAVADFYTPKRKQIKLDPRAIADARHKHSGTVDLLNEYLVDGDEDDNESGGSTDELDDDSLLELPDFHNEGTKPILSSVELSSLQLSLLKAFAGSGFSMSHIEIDEFARENAVFRNQLVDSINEICFEKLDDVLIEEEDEGYVIAENYYRLIIQI